ncbi:MAG: Nramp family divalent metal transporter [Planctomycetota bacterium]|nr:MAG: Nramp family divalent metal transporter [Planctomycetota bacterium]
MSETKTFIEAAEDASEDEGYCFGILPTWTRQEMPAFPGLLHALGPGIVWMALAQGSGELVWWPYIVAKYGLGFMFLLIPACLLQYPVNFEIGRYTLLTGESIWQGFIRLNRWLALAMWMLMTVSFMWLGGFVTAGGMDEINFPGGWSEDTRGLFWSYTFIFIFIIALLLSGVVYRLIERIMMVVAVVTVVGLLLACSQEAVLAKLGEFAGGLARPRWPADRVWDNNDATILLTAITFAGLGAFWTLFYSYWLREKGAGMAAYVGHITSPITRRRQPVLQVGFLPEDTHENAKRWGKWKRYLLMDNSIGILGNLFTTLMCCLLAYALLFPEAKVPTMQDPVDAQMAFFSSAWGPVGGVLFLILATAFLSDTWMTTIDAVSRVHTDVVNAYVPRARKLSQHTWYWIFVLLAGGITVVTLPYATPGTLILISSVIGFAGTVTFTICLLVWNHVVMPKRLPAAFRPRRFSWIFIGIAVVAYTLLAVAYVYVRFFG